MLYTKLMGSNAKLIPIPVSSKYHRWKSLNISEACMPYITA